MRISAGTLSALPVIISTPVGGVLSMTKTTLS